MANGIERSRFFEALGVYVDARIRLAARPDSNEAREIADVAQKVLDLRLSELLGENAPEG
ncbi:hypothetical protein [Hyphomicrobium sp. LHD-15]|uniref:hypothetical protein n=1 Tax=Hyphomicrobium sp. LHD-15 TaxID=3072142 RepID=UPI00280EA853|nr:hypothetical protein [Hyphomicrobium sp. LHD-15]MDQ8700213.1 hypothetical protein [Hyphomicrobium sp. LHD-15]